MKLKLDIGGVLGGPQDGVPYQTRLHAPALFHYVLLLSRIEYFTSEEIMPLLEFIAKEAAPESEHHRRACHGECGVILQDLESRGQREDRKKADAIEKWLATNPFAL